MIKSLIRTIPTISGNYSISCNLNNFVKKTNQTYECFINIASLKPLDDNVNMLKNVACDLTNGKLSYDLSKYFENMYQSFYTDTYLTNSNYNYVKFNCVNTNDNRNKNFEFGCKRISYVKHNKQFQFYAPLYIDNPNDIPEYFIIEIKYKNLIIKKIKIHVGSSDKRNKLGIYLKRHLQKIYQYNVPIIWKYDERKIIYQNAISCTTGAIINFTYTKVPNNNINIKAFDKNISDVYKDNNLCMSQIIPLSFLFNIYDFIDNNCISDFSFRDFKISGYYMNGDQIVKLSDIVTNSYIYKLKYLDNENYTKLVSYDIYNNNETYYSLPENNITDYEYINTINKVFNKWQIYESCNSNNPYILNMNINYTNKYKKYNDYPILKTDLSKQYYTYLSYYINEEDGKHIKHNNLIVPYLYDDHSYLVDQLYNDYIDLVNNSYINWFEVYDDKVIFEHNYIINNWTSMHGLKNSVMHRGVIYTNIPECDYFGVFIKPNIIEYNENIIYGLYDRNLNSNIINESDCYYEKINNIDEYNDEDYIYCDEDDMGITYVKVSEISNNNISFAINKDIIQGYEIIKGITSKNCYIPNVTENTNNINIVRDYLSIFGDNNKINDSIYFSFDGNSKKYSFKEYVNEPGFNIYKFIESDVTFFKKDNYFEIKNQKSIKTYIYNLVNEMIKLTEYHDYSYKKYYDKLKNIINDNTNDYSNYSNIINELKIKFENDILLDNYTKLQLQNKLDNIENNINFLDNPKLTEYSNILYDGKNYNYMKEKDENVNRSTVYIDSMNLDLYKNQIQLGEKIQGYCKFISVSHIKSFNKLYSNIIEDRIFFKKSFISSDKDYTNIKTQMFSLYDELEELKITFKEFINNIKYENDVFIFSCGELKIKYNLYYKTDVYSLTENILSKLIKNQNVKVYLYVKNSDYSTDSFNISDDIENNNDLILQPLFYDVFDDEVFDIVLNAHMNNLHADDNHGGYYYDQKFKTFVKDTKTNIINKFPNAKYYKKININNEYSSGIYTKTCDDGVKLSYIVIETNVMKSTASFNIFGIDNGDNIEIHEFDNNDISTHPNIFKYIYPYMKVDLFNNFICEHSELVKLPNNVKIKIEKNDKQYTLNAKRYFGNIIPLFNDNVQILYDEYEILYYKNSNFNPNSNDNYIQYNALDINAYKPIHVIEQIDSENIKNEFSQYEYKHFNDNKIINLPESFSIDVDLNISQYNLGEYESDEKISYYFKEYISKYYLKSTQDNNYILFLLNKYYITIEKKKIQILFNCDIYNITYKFDIK